VTVHFTRHRRLRREATIYRQVNARRILNGMGRSIGPKCHSAAPPLGLHRSVLNRYGGSKWQRTSKEPVGTLGKWRLRAIVAALCAVHRETSSLAQPIPGKLVHVRSRDLPLCNIVPVIGEPPELMAQTVHFPPIPQLQWKALCTINALERINEDGSNTRRVAERWSRRAGFAQPRTDPLVS
jgi:hypothetical protein